MASPSAIRFLKTALLCFTIALVVVPAVMVANRVETPGGFREVFSSKDTLRDFVESYGVTAPLVFFLLQTMQIVIAPIPGNVTTVAGGMLFGFWKSFALTTAALVCGSSIAFMLSRMLGRPLVDRFVSPKVIDRYFDRLSRRYTVYLFLLFLFPFFPDDALCFLAGLTAIRYPVFLLIVLVARPPGLAFSALVGAGLISMPLWGWIALVLVSVLLLYLSLKYGERIEIRLEKLLFRLRGRRS